MSLVHEFDSFAFVLRTGLVACVFDPSAFYICSIYLILVCCASTLCLLYTSLTHLRLALGVVIAYRSRCVCVWWSERVRSCFACFDVCHRDFILVCFDFGCHRLSVVMGSIHAPAQHFSTATFASQAQKTTSALTPQQTTSTTIQQQQRQHNQHQHELLSRHHHNNSNNTITTNHFTTNNNTTTLQQY